MENQQSTSERTGLGEKLQNLFSIARKKDATVPQADKVENPENRRVGETYEQWGTRICGIVSGSLMALPPYLQKVYHNIYNEQAENVDLQIAARANTQAEIERTNDEIRSIGENIERKNSDIGDIDKRIAELKEEREEIKQSKERVNKEQRLKLIIGLFIIIPLTFYLFLFYSSTFYSAFFRDPETMTDAMNAMFDSNALANAYNRGFLALGFVLSAPIIFLGLGFALHFFSVQTGKAKYFKMLSILLVTVMFDCMLAFKIGEQMHEFGIIIGTFPIGEKYTVGMAIHDINTWAVIFCGFIVYVIWGIVFDMCMSAYDKMDLNKTQLEHIKSEIATQEQRKTTEKANIDELRNQEREARNRVQTLMAKLGHEVYIDYAAIRTEMNNFFAGWVKMMQVLSLGQDKQDEASTICKREMAMLIPNK